MQFLKIVQPSNSSKESSDFDDEMADDTNPTDGEKEQLNKHSRQIMKSMRTSREESHQWNVNH